MKRMSMKTCPIFTVNSVYSQYTVYVQMERHLRYIVFISYKLGKTQFNQFNSRFNQYALFNYKLIRVLSNIELMIIYIFHYGEKNLKLNTTKLL